jgi:hypothetical protein
MIACLEMRLRPARRAGLGRFGSRSEGSMPHPATAARRPRPVPIRFANVVITQSSATTFGTSAPQLSAKEWIENAQPKASSVSGSGNRLVVSGVLCRAKSHTDSRNRCCADVTD